MSVTDAIKNQVAGRVAGALTGNLSRIQGNLPGRARRGPIPGNTGGIEAPGAASMNLSYPLNVEGDEQQGHYIMFMINETTPGKVATTGAAALGQQLDPEQQEAFIDSNLNKGAGKSQSTMSGAPSKSGLWMRRPGTSRMAKAITLYMPPSVKVSYKSNYKDDEISARASAIGDTIGSVIDSVASGGAKSWSAGWETAKKAGSTALEGVGAVAAFVAKASADTFAPGASTLAQLSTGQILGSKMELMFTDVGRRNFSFTFNFIPKSEQEARMVYNIVQTFKEHMLPEHLGSADFPFVGEQKFLPGKILKIPDTFDIHYFYHNNENPFLNRISTCYLTSMDIDYGGEKYVTYEPTKHDTGQVGPPPQRTNISLSFTEIETITRERAKQGF